MAPPQPPSEAGLEWSSEAFDLDDVMVFVNSGPADGPGNTKRTTTPASKPLACARCHSQKASLCAAATPRPCACLRSLSGSQHRLRPADAAENGQALGLAAAVSIAKSA